MKIVLYEPWLQNSGVVTFVNHFRVGVEGLGHDFHVIGPEGAQLQSLAEMTFRNQPKHIHVLREYLETTKPDLFIINNGHHVGDKHYDVPPWLGVLEELKIPFILLCHNSFTNMFKMQKRMDRLLASDMLFEIWAYEAAAERWIPWLKANAPHLVDRLRTYLLPYQRDNAKTNLPIHYHDKNAIYTSRMLKGKGADTAMMLAGKYDVPVEFYGWYPQFRAGTTHAELAATEFWNDDLYKGEHDMVAGETYGPYDHGRVHLNLNRAYDWRGQPEYVTFEAIDAGLIPVCRVEHWRIDKPSVSYGVTDIRHAYKRPDDPQWQDLARLIKEWLAWDDKTLVEASIKNWEYLEHHNPLTVVQKMLEGAQEELGS